ncbi:MAG: hypothetical protein K1X53_11455, partial [Candidatus Sumerlaeaceae bacterium]|nr:hypothetical protein [Candidatus Sumerlaeaceae bacterium]
MARSDRKSPPRLLSAALLLAGCLAMQGCLPEDPITALEFSPDGSHIACVSELRGLTVLETTGTDFRTLARDMPIGNSISWSPGGRRIAFESNAAGNWDVWLTDLDGNTTQVTQTRSRQQHPMFLDAQSLYFLTNGAGKSELYIYHQDGGESHEVVAPEFDVLNPVLSPDKRRIAFVSFEDLRPQVFIFDSETGAAEQVTSGTTLFDLVPHSLAWTAKSDGIGFVRQQPVGGGKSAKAGMQSSVMLAMPGDSKGAAPRERTLFSENGKVGGLQFAENSRELYYSVNRQLVRRDLESKNRASVTFQDFAMTMPRLNPATDALAFAVQSQFVAVRDTARAKPRFLIRDFQEKLQLAEEYFQQGKNRKTSDIYAELASGIQRTEDPNITRFLVAANQLRLGQAREAVRSVETMLASGNIPEGLPEPYVWRMLGYGHLIYLSDPHRAMECFAKYRQLVSLQESGTTQSARKTADPVLDALAILKIGDAEMTERYAAALRARINGDFDGMSAEFGTLLAQYKSFPAIRDEYLNALAGYDREIFVFSPSQKPFAPGRQGEIEYLERFVRLTPASPQTDRVKVELFQKYIESRAFDKARTLLSQSLAREQAISPLEGIGDVFSDYLEKPETEPWLEAAMREVFLHPAVRPALDRAVGEAETRFLLHLVSVKLALVDRKLELARTEADGALGTWGEIPEAERTATLHYFYGRLLTFRGREAELRGLFAEAATYYDQALDYLRTNRADEFEFYFEVKFRAAMLRDLLVRSPELLRKLIRIEQVGGDDLVNPTWDEG